MKAPSSPHSHVSAMLPTQATHGPTAKLVSASGEKLCLLGLFPSPLPLTRKKPSTPACISPLSLGARALWLAGRGA